MQGTCLELGVCDRKLADSLLGMQEWVLLGWKTGPNDLLTALSRLNLYGTMILKQGGSHDLGWGAGPDEAQSGKKWMLRSSGLSTKLGVLVFEGAGGHAEANENSPGW